MGSLLITVCILGSQRSSFWSLQKDPDQNEWTNHYIKGAGDFNLLRFVDLLLHTASQDLGLGLISVSKGYGVTPGTTISLGLELCVTGWKEKQYCNLPSTVSVHDTVILIMSYNSTGSQLSKETKHVIRGHTMKEQCSLE